MVDKKYSYKDYFKPSANEQALMKAYKAAKTKEDKIDYWTQLKRLRGVVEDENGEYISDRLFVKYILTVFMAIYINGNIAMYNWKNHCYEFLDGAIILGFFKKLLDQMDDKLWNSKVEGRYNKRFVRDIPVKLKTYQMPEDYVVFTNGLFQLSTGKFIPGDHPDLVYNICCTGYDYDAAATCPAFIKFVDDVFNSDKDLIAVCQEMCGYTFCYGSNPLQVIVIFWGYGRNGKGVICNITQKTHGEVNCSATSVAQLGTKFGLGQMFDKVLNISNENDENVIADTSILKNISGNDVCQVEKKYKDPVPVRIFCKLWIATNDITFKDSSKGFEERIVPLPFVNTYVSSPKPGTNEKLRDNDLENKLTQELPGIFNWMYEGLVRLRDNNWRITDSKAVEEQRKRLVEASNAVQLFVNVKVHSASGARMKKPDTYRRFKEWTQANGINVGTFVSAQKFYPKFEEIIVSKGFSKATKRIQGENYYSDFTIDGNNNFA